MAASEQTEQAGNSGYHSNHMDTIFKAGFSFSGYERDLLALNLGDGRYLDVSGVSGADSLSDGRGSVFADFDNDGDLDIFLTASQNEAHHLFRNNVGNRRGFVRIELVGTSSGVDAYGAQVRLVSRSGLQTKLKAGGSGYLSQHDPRLLFGLDGNERAESIEVTWPGGVSQRVDDVAAGSAIRITEGRPGYEMLNEKRFSLVDPLDAGEALLAGLGLRREGLLGDLPLRDASGRELRLQDVLQSGRRLLVNFWATWCVPCAREMPELQALQDRLEASGVDLVGVSVDLDTVVEVPRVLASRGITYPSYTTDERGLEMLYPSGEAVVPLTLLLDQDGRILEIHSGWSERSERAKGSSLGLTLDGGPSREPEVSGQDLTP